MRCVPHLHSRRDASVILVGLTALALSVGSTGCARGLFLDPSGYDAQACAEHALRGDVDHETALQATVVFREACGYGDAGACSGLGIIYERGLGGVERDASKAASLYRRACDRGNGRACENLRDLEAARALTAGARHGGQCATGSECGMTRAAAR